MSDTDTPDWTNRVVLVTGASRGVGRALAVMLGSRGASVACAARATAERQFKLPGTVDETAAAVEDAGGEALAVPADLSRQDDVAAMIDRTVAHFGRLDALVNNAAVMFPGDLDIEMKRYDLTFDINVRAPLLATRLARPHLAAAPEGRVLNVSSMAALSYYDDMMSYGMSKAAVEHLTFSTAAILAEEGIAVNGFRIDYPVASEGFVMNAPHLDHSTWVDTSVPAEGIVWMLDQPLSYTGQNESMLELAERTGTMQELIELLAQGATPTIS